MAVAALFLGGCLGVIPQAERASLDPSLTFADVAANPDAARGRHVAFGGEILNATPRAQDTEIEVLQRSLLFDDSPDPSSPSGGRFLIRRAGFLDPAVYAKGRLVTVAGPVEGSENRPIGDTTYRYPVVQADFLYLWPVYQLASVPPPYYYFPYPWYPPYPFYFRYRYYPYWYWYGPPFWW